MPKGWIGPLLQAATSEKARSAVMRIVRLAEENPAAARVAREQLQRARVSLEGVRKARTPEARIAKKLTAVEQMAAGDAGAPGAPLGGWQQDVGTLRQALTLAGSQDGRHRAASLRAIDDQADALLARVIQSLLDQPGAGRSSPPTLPSRE